MDPRLVPILEKSPIGKQIELLLKLHDLSKKKQAQVIRRCLPSIKTLCAEVARFMCVTFQENHRLAMGGLDLKIVQFRNNHRSALIKVDMEIVHGLVIILAFYADIVLDSFKHCFTMSISDVVNLKNVIFRDRLLSSPSSSQCLSQGPRSPPNDWGVSPTRWTHSLPSTSPPKRSKKLRSMVSLSKLRTQEEIAKITLQENDLLSILRRDDLMESFGDEDLNLQEVTSEGQPTFTTIRGTVLNRLNIPSFENLTISQQARLDMFELPVDEPWGNRICMGRSPQIEGSARFMNYSREEAARIAAYRELLNNPPSHVFTPPPSPAKITEMGPPAPRAPLSETSEPAPQQIVNRLPPTFEVYHDTPGDEPARPPAMDTARPPLADLPPPPRPPRPRPRRDPNVPAVTRGNVRLEDRDMHYKTIEILNPLLIPRDPEQEVHQAPFTFEEGGHFMDPDGPVDWTLFADPLFTTRPSTSTTYKRTARIIGDPQSECPDPNSDIPRPPFFSAFMKRRFPEWCKEQLPPPPQPGTPPPPPAGEQWPVEQIGPVEATIPVPDLVEPIAPIPPEPEGLTSSVSEIGLSVQPVLAGESAVSGAIVGATRTSLSTPGVNIPLPSPATMSSVSAGGLAVPGESGAGRQPSVEPPVSAPSLFDATINELVESSSTNMADVTALHRAHPPEPQGPVEIGAQPLEVPTGEVIPAPIMIDPNQENIPPPPPPEADESPARILRRRPRALPVVREGDILSDLSSNDDLSPPRRRRRRRRRRRPNRQPPIEQQPGEQPPIEQQPGEQPPIEQQPGEQPPIEQQPGEQPPIEPDQRQTLPQPAVEGDQAPPPQFPEGLPPPQFPEGLPPPEVPEPMEEAPAEVMPRPSTSNAEVPMPEEAPPPEPQPEYVPPGSQTRLLSREILDTLRAKAADKNTRVLTFADICPPGVTDREVAALTFRSLIVLAQKNLVKLHQTESTGNAHCLFITLLDE